jgi:hypothetical protein
MKSRMLAGAIMLSAAVAFMTSAPAQDAVRDPLPGTTVNTAPLPGAIPNTPDIANPASSTPAQPAPQIQAAPIPPPQGVVSAPKTCPCSSTQVPPYTGSAATRCPC